MTLLKKEDYLFWKTNSYIVLKGMFSDEIESISNWINDIKSWPIDMNKWLNFYEMNNSSVLSRIENFVPYHTQLATVLLNHSLLEILGSLMEEEALLYKDRINFKPPEGGAHAAHQDGIAYESSALEKFNGDKTPFISVLISIDSATSENGCFEVAENWPIENLDILPMERPYPENPNFSKIAQKYEDELSWKQIETNPGDVILFTERLPHRSKTNSSSKSRRILYGVYNPVSEGDNRSKYFEDKRKNINDARYMVGNPHAIVK